MMMLLKRWGPWLGAILSGVMLALCFEPFQLADGVWVAMVPLLLGLWVRGGVVGSSKRFRGKRVGFGIGWVSGFVFWAINLKWLFGVASFGYLILAGYLAVFFGVFGMFAVTVGNPLRGTFLRETAYEGAGRSVIFAAVNAGLWAGLEWVRGWLFTGFGWNGLGVAFHERLHIAQAAELVGVAGLSFLAMFANAVLTQVGLRFWKGFQSGKLERHWDFGVALGVITLAFLYGSSRISTVRQGAGQKFHVLLVQQNIPQVAGKVMWSASEVHEAFEGETRAALAEIEKENERRVAEAVGEVELVSPDWVVWPEVVLYGRMLTTKEGKKALMPRTDHTVRAMREAGVKTLIAGVNEIDAVEEEGRFYQDPEGTYYNTLMAVTPEGELIAYRKEHLVIYGEFIPFVDSVKFLGDIYEMVAGVPWGGNMGRGGGEAGFSLRAGGREVGVIPSICFEDTVPRVTRKYSRGGAEVIVNITNDGWFGESEGSRQHFANAKFRCIELRAPMVRSANRGVTGVVDATGSLEDAETGEEQVLLDEDGRPFLAGHVFGTVRVNAEGVKTVYARFGDWFAVMGLVAGLVWWVARRGALKRNGV